MNATALYPNSKMKISLYTGDKETVKEGEYTEEVNKYFDCSEWISNASFSLNETNNQYYFLARKGFAMNSTTGLAPVLSCSGKRMPNDSSQQRIEQMKYKLGPERKGILKLTIDANPTDVDVPAAETVYFIPVNVQNIVPFGGEGNADSDFSVDFAFDGEPSTAEDNIPDPYEED